jgi:hypothetical protein
MKSREEPTSTSARGPMGDAFNSSPTVHTGSVSSGPIGEAFHSSPRAYTGSVSTQSPELPKKLPRLRLKLPKGTQTQ